MASPFLCHPCIKCEGKRSLSKPQPATGATCIQLLTRPHKRPPGVTHVTHNHAMNEEEMHVCEIRLQKGATHEGKNGGGWDGGGGGGKPFRTLGKYLSFIIMSLPRNCELICLTVSQLVSNWISTFCPVTGSPQGDQTHTLKLLSVAKSYSQSRGTKTSVPHCTGC